MAACDALIKATQNAPKAVADALVNRGQAAWYANRIKQAFADLDVRLRRRPPSQGEGDRDAAQLSRLFEQGWLHSMGRVIVDDGRRAPPAMDREERARIFAEIAETRSGGGGSRTAGRCLHQPRLQMAAGGFEADRRGSLGICAGGDQTGAGDHGEPLRLCRRPFCLSHAAMAVSFSMAK